MVCRDFADRTDLGISEAVIKSSASQRGDLTRKIARPVPGGRHPDDWRPHSAEVDARLKPWIERQAEPKPSRGGDPAVD